jgi:hypothetical protein
MAVTGTRALRIAHHVGAYVLLLTLAATSSKALDMPSDSHHKRASVAKPQQLSVRGSVRIMPDGKLAFQRAESESEWEAMKGKPSPTPTAPTCARSCKGGPS